LALQKLFTRPFWKRIWVVQEVMLAKQLTLFCGFKSFPWRQITDCIVGLETIADSGAQLSYELSPLLETPAAHLVQEKALWELQPPDKLRALPLKTLLEIYGGMEATHSVDKVYGLLGLSLSHCSTRGGKGKMGLQAAGAERRIRFPISYAKSVEAVYADVFRSVDLYQQREGQGLADPEIRDFNNLLVSLLGLPNPATQPNQKPLLLVEDHVSWML
jgi:hypothetical protein